MMHATLHISGRGPRARRGAALVVFVIALVIVQLVVVTTVLNTGRDHTLTVRRVEAVRSNYAAESGLQLGLRELAIGIDEDGDGTVGGISDDGNAANDPVIDGGRVSVVRTDVGLQVELDAAGRSGLARRALGTTIEFSSSPALPYVSGRVNASAAAQTVTLSRSFTTPVVVCTLHYDNNTAPVVVRVSNVLSNSFDVWLQNPGDITAPVADVVHYVVMEAGAYVINGQRFEAQRTTVTRTDRKSSWVGEVQSYLQGYAQPVVVGQVMSANDPDWSVFWSRGSSRTQPPNAGTIRVGKHVGEDSDTTRAAEVVGFFVFERTSAVIGGILTDARRSSDNIRGFGNGPPFSAPFDTPFPAAAPEVVLTSLTAMDGNDGGWGTLFGLPYADTDDAFVMIDEDQIGDADRNHTTEQVAVVAFEFATGSPEVVAWTESAGVP